jgi:acyl carrier protein
LEFLGRLDHQVKVRGFRIELGEIEVQLGRHPAVQEAVVLARTDAGGDRELVAYVVPRPGETATVEVLRPFLEERLPEPMVPAFFLEIAGMPLTAHDKIDRAALAELALPERGARLEARFVAPRNAVEEVLAGMWAELLEVEEVGVYDDFFALGGHSLKATRLLSWVEEAFEVSVPLRRVFEQPTVAALAADLLADAAVSDRVEAAAKVLIEMADLSDEELAELEEDEA